MTTQRGRREFFGLSGAAVAGAVTAPWIGAQPVAAAAADADADLVVFNAKVYTVERIEKLAGIPNGALEDVDIRELDTAPADDFEAEEITEPRP